ncbi:MAG TPA: ChbG/HpnK family deacetylase [Micropepsaceae bacterium]|nr:ChbG/HpnK family deacetylase [Micropepsaceae bacterium]
MHLRVNADDLGLSARVNDEAFELISRGLIDSASVIANAPETGDAIRRAKQFSQCRFGLHLNITQFKPLRADAAFAPVLKPDGSFTNVFWRVHKDNSLRRAIYQEWVQPGSALPGIGIAPGTSRLPP